MTLARVMIYSMLLVGVARAQEPSSLSPREAEQRSRLHFQLGHGHLQLKEYDAAIREFEIGYRFKALPLFLYNIGQVAVLAGQPDKALDYFERYLTASPKAPERAEVMQLIAQLKRERPASSPAPSTEAAAPSEPETEPGTEPATATAGRAPRTLATSAAVVKLPADALPPVTPDKKRHRGLYIALGILGGGALVGGAIALGLTLSHNNTGYNDWGQLVVTPR